MSDAAQHGGQAGARVCVTGASGFVGSHVTAELLRRGFQVNATVRDRGDAAKCAPLTELARRHPGSLGVYEADVRSRADLARALHNCVAVCHVASPVKYHARDPYAEIVAPAIAGATNVARAARSAGSVRRIVLTSSMSAVLRYDRPRSYVFTETDWNEQASLGHAYDLSKVEAERACGRLLAQRSAHGPIDLVVLNPALILGPVLAKHHVQTSPGFVHGLLYGEFPGCPALHFPVVDVRDVACAHAAAVEQRRGFAGRFILSSQALWFHELAELLRHQFPARRITHRRLPRWLAYLWPLFDRRIPLGYLQRYLGKQWHFDGTRAPRTFGFAYRPLHCTVADCATSILNLMEA